jgi:FAD/FMN-containing dehydrogenase
LISDVPRVAILGVEAVLADGRIFDGLSTLRKDNTGYDLKQLFIGAEGTLGIITALSLVCPPKPKSVNVAFLGLDSFEKVQELFVRTKQDLGEILSAYEFLDRASMDLVLKHHSQLGAKDPLDSKQPFYVLIETSGSNMEHDKEKLISFLDSIMSSGLVADGTIAADKAQIKSLWYIRENITESLQREGKVYKYDVSLPVGKMYNLVENMRERLAYNPKIGVVGYGHLGDANLHLNIHEPTYTDQTLGLVEPYVYEFTCTFLISNNSSPRGHQRLKSFFLYFFSRSVACWIYLC